LRVHRAAIAALRLNFLRIAAAAEIGNPAPPNSSGISAARYPASPRAATKSVGYSRALSRARQYSPGNFWQSLATSSRISL